MALHPNRGKTMEVNDQAEAVRNNYRRQGATAERERIIALLYEHGHYCEQPLAALIALIKGEQE